MFELMVFGGLLILFVIALGLPYPQTWYGRWKAPL